MLNDFIAIEAKGIPELMAKLKKLPPEIATIGINEANKYLVDVLRSYPPQKSVPRRQAYPHLRTTSPTGKEIIGYKSWAQFKLVMAKVNNGEVPYTRTQEFRRNWKIIGEGNESMIANETPYGKFLMDDELQSGGARAIGWKTLAQVLQTSGGKAGNVAVTRAVPKWMWDKFSGAVKKAAAKIGLDIK